MAHLEFIAMHIHIKGFIYNVLWEFMMTIFTRILAWLASSILACLKVQL